jgi:hypothetical protein
LILPALSATPLHQPVEHPLVCIETRTGGAALTHIEEDRARRAADRNIHVGVGEDDGRRFAAEFQRYLLQIAGGRLDDQLADFGRAGECNLVDVRMRRQRRAGGLAKPGQDIDDAIGETGFLNKLPEAQCAERRLLGRLQDDRAAGRQCRRNLPRRHHQWEVPRDDLPDDADRFAQGIGMPVAGRGDGDCRAVDLGRPAGHVPQDLVRTRQVDIARVADRLAVVERLEFGNLIGVAFEKIGELPNQLAAILRRGLRLGAGLEGAQWGFDGFVDIGCIGLGHSGNHLTGRWVEHVEPLARSGVLPIAVD